MVKARESRNRLTIQQGWVFSNMEHAQSCLFQLSPSHESPLEYVRQQHLAINPSDRHFHSKIALRLYQTRNNRRTAFDHKLDRMIK